MDKIIVNEVVDVNNGIFFVCFWVVDLYLFIKRYCDCYIGIYWYGFFIFGVEL